MRFAPLTLALLCSCVIAGSDEEATLAGVEQHLKANCDEWGCGTNSPNVDSFGLHELNEKGLPNEGGFRIKAFEKNGVGYALNVSKGRLIGRNASGSIANDALVGARIWIAKDNHTAYVLRVAAVGEAPLWAQQNGQWIWVQTYVLQWTSVINGVPLSRWKNMCKDPIKELGMQAYHSVLFEGDRINAKAKEIDAIDNDWFNIGCSGSTLAKMYLTGHTEASKAYGFTTTIDERQAMLKMFSADFCGDGAAFTVGGTPLEWMDDKGWMNYTRPVKLEARWTRDGVSCLNDPRITDPDLLDVGEYSTIEAAIKAHCGGTLPPKCSWDAADLAGHHVVSAHPL